MKKGDHTWKRALAYHLCPNCKQVVESRKSWKYQMGAYLKEETCPRCESKFVLEKAKPPPIGPFLGEAQAPEIEWRS